MNNRSHTQTDCCEGRDYCEDIFYCEGFIERDSDNPMREVFGEKSKTTDFMTSWTKNCIYRCEKVYNTLSFNICGK